MSETNQVKQPEKPLQRKPSMKKKLPEVRQTLTSKYRLLKANPLLIYELNKAEPIKDSLNQPLKTLVKSFDKLMPAPEIEKPPPRASLKPSKTLPASVRPKVEIRPKSSHQSGHESRIEFKPGQCLSSTRVEHQNRSLSRRDTFTKQDLKTSVPNPNRPSIKRSESLKHKPANQQKNTENGKKVIRRSLSAQHFDRKSGKASHEASSCYKMSDRTVSLESLKNDNNPKSEFSPIVEEASFKSDLSFKTPSAYNRRSMFNNKTPLTTGQRRSLFLSTPSSDELKNRLNNWLKKRGKSIGDFHHLKCFGYHGNMPPAPPKPDKKEEPTQDEENKENIETAIQDADSYEDLKIIVTKPDYTENTSLQAVAKDALLDLYKLIVDGFPTEQCEAWLKLIKMKYKHLEEEPQYWECRAAIEQARGNISSAVECYKTAIVQGAEINSVDESLDQLLQKFSLLNINTDQNTTKNRAHIIQEARNVFKSSIIQFAVQERILKKKNKDGVSLEKKVVATPVRRSTRLSRSAFTSTPGVKIYSSLKEVDSPVRKEMNFQCNSALFD